MTETWNYLQSPAANAATNMALDEALLRMATDRRQPLLRVYSWHRPAVSIGYFQKFPSPFLKGEGQGEGFDQIVRRLTGGGLVYHGDGVDTTYTIVVPPDHRLYTMSTADAYCTIHKAVAAALSLAESCARVSDPARNNDRRSLEISGRPAVTSGARSGDRRTTSSALHQTQIASPHGSYECFQNPVHGDVVADGKKLAGAAQRRTKWGLLHQGSIAASVTDENLRRGFTEILGIEFVDYTLSADERALAAKLVREKYATNAWNRR